jgi:hypothetical protein
MISPRSLANQKLYHARILANSWRGALADEQIPATVLADAFDQASRDHLRQAYGWFLLEIVPPASLPEVPPQNCAGLPSIAPGKALPGEIRELRRLEQQGWLAEMLGLAAPARTQPRQPGGLGVLIAETSAPDQVDRWIGRLEETFERMADSLDEY